MKPKERIDPVKYRKLVNQFRKEKIDSVSEDSPIKILDTAQNFSLWLDRNGYKIVLNRRER